jgi:hypothetical protein
MGVNDPTAGLPWWAQQGGQPQGQASPPGYGGTSWLDYLASMFGPGSAQAAENDPMAALRSQLDKRQPGPPAPDNSFAAALPTGPPPSPSGGPSWFPGGQNTPMPWNGPTASPPPRPGPNPDAPSPNAQPVNAGGGAAAAPRAAPMGGGPANRFVQIDRPNAPAAGMNRGAPQMTALNLAGLFGGQAPPGPPQVGAPRPAVPGPLASSTTGQPMPLSSLDADYGLPDARGAPYPYALGRKAPPGALAAASLKQRYG